MHKGSWEDPGKIVNKILNNLNRILTTLLRHHPEKWKKKTPKEFVSYFQQISLMSGFEVRSSNSSFKS